MATKATIIVCVQTLLIQSTLSRCIAPTGPACVPAILGCEGLARCVTPFIPAALSGSFAVTSSSSVAPTGISVISENVYEGFLSADGTLSLLGGIGVVGQFPTAGTGAVSYGCGDDGVAIDAQERPGVTGMVPVIAAPLAMAPGYAPFLSYGLGCGMGYGYGGIDSEIYGSGYSSCGCAI